MYKSWYPPNPKIQALKCSKSCLVEELTGVFQIFPLRDALSYNIPKEKKFIWIQGILNL